MMKPTLFNLAKLLFFILPFALPIQAAQDPSQGTVTVKICGEVARSIRSINIDMEKTYAPDTQAQRLFFDLKQKYPQLTSAEIENFYFNVIIPKFSDDGYPKIQKVLSRTKLTLKDLKFKTSGINRIDLKFIKQSGVNETTEIDTLVVQSEAHENITSLSVYR
ncbi:MAG: hypothetical protein AAF380_00320 [Bacteroidota bacterium]